MPTSSQLRAPRRVIFRATTPGRPYFITSNRPALCRDFWALLVMNFGRQRRVAPTLYSVIAKPIRNSRLRIANYEFFSERLGQRSLRKFVLILGRCGHRPLRIIPQAHSSISLLWQRRWILRSKRRRIGNKKTIIFSAACGQAALHWIYKQTIWFNNSLLIFAGRRGRRPLRIVP